MANRKSNLELLRIICMLLLIGHHCVVHGTGVPVSNPLALNKVFTLLMIPSGKICFIAFLALSTWFMVNQHFKMERFIKMWLQVFFYSVVFTIAFVFVTGTSLTPAQWISCFFPIIGNSHGFAAAYLALYLLLPFLVKVIKNITQKQTLWLIFLLVYFQMISQYIGNITGYFQRFPSEISLFILCFIISYYLKNWTPKHLNNFLFTSTIFFICWGGMAVLYIVQYKFPNISIINYFLKINGDEFGLINIISGYMLFFTFNNIKMNYHKYINIIAKSTFGVLLIHDHNYFRPAVWFNVVKVQNWLDSSYYIFYFCAYVLIIFSVCVLIDKCREKVFDNLLLSKSIIKKVCNKFDSWINE